MTDREKWVEALARLTWKTMEGEIKWQTTAPKDVSAEGVDKAFETTFHGQRIRAFQRRQLLNTILFGGPFDRVVIEFLDNSGNAVYRPPVLDGAKDLFSAIEHHTKPAGEFIDALLRD
jgi:hypothetical protein